MILDSKTLTELIHLYTMNSHMLKTQSKINLAIENDIHENVMLDCEKFFKDIIDLFNK